MKKIQQQIKMHHTQLLAFVQSFAAIHQAYVSIDPDEIFVFENGKVHFQSSKIAISSVPYTQGAFYVRIKNLYFPAAFTPSELNKYMTVAWNLECEPAALYLRPRFLSHELCK